MYTVQLLVKFTVLWCTVKDMERLGKNPPDNFGTVWRNTKKNHANFRADRGL